MLPCENHPDGLTQRLHFLAGFRFPWRFCWFGTGGPAFLTPRPKLTARLEKLKHKGGRADKIDDERRGLLSRLFLREETTSPIEDEVNTIGKKQSIAGSFHLA